MFCTGCGKSHVNYSSSSRTQDSAPPPSSYDSHRSAKLPSGSGGYRKTGKPYKIAGHWYYPLETADGYNETGIASWYGTKFHGKKTANGERYDMYAMSAAHKTLPLPTMVRVTNLDNGRSVVVRVNDRGPFVKSRVIDLSYAAARTLGYDDAGTASVRVEVLGNSRNVRSAPVRQPVRLPQPKVTTATSRARPGAMYIQLGAFSSHSNARQLEESLKHEYPSVRIYKKDGGYSGIFRVRLGPFTDVEKIEDVVLSIQDRGHSNAIVVIE
ncbi:MAG: septal ring lytic transglycosylase RlpA family protein [Mariprofundaceae bacterium]|nr:septal ring lytic transglycosylase RlpA family protein [Mariprofundaceae bacterium]